MQETRAKRLQDHAWPGENDGLLGVVQEIKIWPYFQVTYAQTRIQLREWNS